MAWEVLISGKASKAARRLPEGVRLSLADLLKEIVLSGPVRGNWPNYGKLAPGRHHCHIKKGKPTYVAVWEELGGKINLVEVVYVGSHEKAPY